MDSLEFNEEALQAIEVYEQHRSDLNDINELLTATDNEIEVLQEQTLQVLATSPHDLVF